MDTEFSVDAELDRELQAMKESEYDRIDSELEAIVDKILASNAIDLAGLDSTTVNVIRSAIKTGYIACANDNSIDL